MGWCLLIIYVKYFNKGDKNNILKKTTGKISFEFKG